MQSFLKWNEHIKLQIEFNQKCCQTYMVKYVANTFRKKADICSFAPYQKVQGNQKKLPLSIYCF